MWYQLDVEPKHLNQSVLSEKKKKKKRKKKKKKKEKKKEKKKTQYNSNRTLE